MYYILSTNCKYLGRNMMLSGFTGKKVTLTSDIAGAKAYKSENAAKRTAEKLGAGYYVKNIDSTKNLVNNKTFTIKINR